MTKEKLWWAIIAASFIFSMMSFKYTNSVDKTFSAYSVAQAQEVPSKTDFQAFRLEVLGRLDSLNNKLDYKADKR